jgi:hypothetical protein
MHILALSSYVPLPRKYLWKSCYVFELQCKVALPTVNLSPIRLGMYYYNTCSCLHCNQGAEQPEKGHMDII